MAQQYRDGWAVATKWKFHSSNSLRALDPYRLMPVARRRKCPVEMPRSKAHGRMR